MLPPDRGMEYRAARPHLRPAKGALRAPIPEPAGASVRTAPPYWIAPYFHGSDMCAESG
ncbi:hypothetical protein D9M72_455840 [compost metagenome]